jgi:hypothetical protein
VVGCLRKVAMEPRSQSRLSAGDRRARGLRIDSGNVRGSHSGGIPRGDGETSRPRQVRGSVGSRSVAVRAAEVISRGYPRPAGFGAGGPDPRLRGSRRTQRRGGGRSALRRAVAALVPAGHLLLRDPRVGRLRIRLSRLDSCRGSAREGNQGPGARNGGRAEGVDAGTRGRAQRRPPRPDDSGPRGLAPNRSRAPRARDLVSRVDGRVRDRPVEPPDAAKRLRGARLPSGQPARRGGLRPQPAHRPSAHGEAAGRPRRRRAVLQRRRGAARGPSRRRPRARDVCGRPEPVDLRACSHSSFCAERRARIRHLHALSTRRS